MRIAYVDFILDPARPGRTGLSDLVWDMAKRMGRMGDEVHVVGPYTAEQIPSEAVQVHGFALPPIGYRNIVGHTLIVLRAWHRLRRLGRLDVIHCPEYHSAAIVSSLEKGVPVVLTEPGNIYERIAYGNPYDAVTTVVYKLAARAAASRCTGIIATSEWMSEWWRKTGASVDKVVLIPLGVDTALFRPAAGARQRLGLREDARIILCATRLSRENGVELVLEAGATVMHEIAACELHIVGDGPERIRLRELARALGIANRTEWHGWVDFASLPLFYSAADVFAFAGRSGGTPRVLLQAMACGVAVVAARIGGIVDHVIDGRNGLLFAPGSASDLAARLAELLASSGRARQLGENAALYVKEKLDWDVLIPQIRGVYRGLARSAVNGAGPASERGVQ